MKKQIFWLFFAALGLWTACTVEKETVGASGNETDETNGVRQEVLLTFKNKLAISQAATKAGDTPLATAQENSVTALDVYVFASDSETGNYTFQERLAYRASGEELPLGSKELEVEAGSKENEFTSLLKLQKGLFVKLYCIANQPLLVDPANEGNVVTDTYFQPLTQTTPGQAGSKVATEGVPSESLFQSFHTPFIASAGDTLVCPLPMSGAYTQPLDLTDYSVSSRMQVGFKLTRAVARFDIINNAALSRFTIDSIGMANGRKAVTFFPIQAYGDQPTARPDELITYPLRTFSGDKANTGTQTGAFYAYPSFPSDETGLILKGRYKINETETKAVSYPVAFKQTDAQGNGAYIEINPNHRYTVAITQADEYKLQTNIIASDWADDGSIDEYNPGETNGEVAITIPVGFTGKSQWDASTRTASMSLDAGSSLDVSIPTNSAVVVSKRYSGRDQRYDWLEVSAPTVAQTKTFTAFGYQYTLSLKDGYAKNRYPKATLRFTDAVTGEESIVFVEAVASPELVEIPKVPGDTNLNSMDIATQTASIFRTTGSSLKIKLLCINGVDMESAPSWLKVEKTKEEGGEAIFTLILLDRDVADTEGTVVFHNSKKPDNLKTDITVQLQDASVAPAFNSLGGDGNVFTAAHDGVSDDIQMPVKDGNTFAIGITSISGVEVAIDFDGGTEWLKHNGEVHTPTVSTPAPVLSAQANATQESAGEGAANSKIGVQTGGVESIDLYAGNKKNTIIFTLDNSKLSGGKTATVTLKNKTGGKDYIFTVTPKYIVPTVSLQSSVPSNDKLENTALTLYKLPSTASTVTLKIVSFGGSKLEYTGSGFTLPSSMESTDNEATYTLTVTDAITGGKLKVMNYADNTQYTEYTVTAVKSDITAVNDAVTLTATNGQKAQTAITSPLGFKAAVTDWNGGSSWFSVTNAWAGGNVNLLFTANTALTKVRPATVTLTNNIVEGGNKTITVTPAYTVPAVSLVANTASPTQNSVSGTTIKLYKVSGSKLNIKASAMGGTQIQSATGVTVTPTGTDAYTTERVYTVTWNGSSTSGSFYLVNTSDNSKKTLINVTIASPSITVPSGTVNINLVANQAGSKGSLSSPEGFTVAANNINWGSGGIAWFDLTTTDVAGGSGKSVGIKVKSNLTSLDASKVKAATVTLTNKIANGGNATFTVTPVWMAPTNASGQLTSFTVNAGASAEIRITTPFGSVGVSSSSSGVANYQSFNSSTSIITLQTGSAGSSTIKVYNSKDNTKYINYTVTVKAVPASSYITITNGGMTRKWAVGNLVAQGSNSCTIGSATDKGLMFKWGSLLGYDATTTGNPATPVVKPNAYSAISPFAACPYIMFTDIGAADPTFGTGDPCRYYLGGSWRLPTADEYRDNLGGGVSGDTTFPVWQWVTSPANGVYTGPTKQLFFPAAGYRNSSDGSLADSGSRGSVWSSTPSGAFKAYYLCFYNSNAYVSNYFYSSGSGFSVRCVQE